MFSFFSCSSEPPAFRIWPQRKEPTQVHGPVHVCSRWRNQPGHTGKIPLLVHLWRNSVWPALSARNYFSMFIWKRSNVTFGSSCPASNTDQSCLCTLGEKFKGSLGWSVRKVYIWMFVSFHLHALNCTSRSGELESWTKSIENASGGSFQLNFRLSCSFFSLLNTRYILSKQADVKVLGIPFIEKGRGTHISLTLIFIIVREAGESIWPAFFPQRLLFKWACQSDRELVA